MVISVVIAFVAGVWAAGLVNADFAALSVGAAVIALTAWRGVRADWRYSPALVVALFFVVGMIRWLQADVVSPYDISRFVGRTVTVYGTVTDLPQWWNVDQDTVKVRYTIAVSALGDGQPELSPVTGAVAVQVYQSRTMARAAFGDKVIMYGKLRQLHGYNNPGLVNSVGGLRQQGITARLVVRPEDFHCFPGSPPAWAGLLAKWREVMTVHIRQAMSPGDAAILTGVLFGGYFGIEREVVRNFAATGLVHILSVSGTHIALVAGCLIWLGTRFRLRKPATAGLAALAVILYALLSGLTPPVVRSLIMGLAALAAVILKRESDTGRALALAVLLMIAYQPILIYNISFQLSVGATAGLVWLYPKTATQLSRFMPSWLAGPLAVTLAAQLGALPVMAWYFSGVSLGSFLANLVVLPLIEMVVVIGLTACLTGLVAPLAGQALLAGTALLIGGVVDLTGLIATLPGSVLYLPAMGLAAGIVYFCVLAWIYGYLARFMPPVAEVVRRWPRRAAVGVAALIILAVVDAYYPRPLAVHFIDVGQGDAALVTTPHGHALLIDTGGTELSDFDVGERIVVPYLKHYGITSLDYLILTHGHKDHAGGAASIGAVMPVAHVILARESFSPAVEALLRTVGSQGLTPAYAGQTVMVDGVRLETVYASETGEVGRGNETSCVVRVTYGRHSFLFTGDLGGAGETELINAGLESGTVLKVGHHGAKTSTSAQFLQTYAPQYAVISAGYANRFGHPHSETLQRLAAGGVTVYRTDRDGAVVFRTDGQKITVDTFLPVVGR